MLLHTKKRGERKSPRYHPHCAKSTAYAAKKPRSVNAGKRPSFRRKLKSSTALFSKTPNETFQPRISLSENGKKKSRFFVNAFQKYNCDKILLSRLRFVKCFADFFADIRRKKSVKRKKGENNFSQISAKSKLIFKKFNFFCLNH